MKAFHLLEVIPLLLGQTVPSSSVEKGLMSLSPTQGSAFVLLWVGIVSWVIILRNRHEVREAIKEHEVEFCDFGGLWANDLESVGFGVEQSVGSLTVRNPQNDVDMDGLERKLLTSYAKRMFAMIMRLWRMAAVSGKHHASLGDSLFTTNLILPGPEK